MTFGNQVIYQLHGKWSPSVSWPLPSFLPSFSWPEHGRTFNILLLWNSINLLPYWISSPQLPLYFIILCGRNAHKLDHFFILFMMYITLTNSSNVHFWPTFFHYFLHAFHLPCFYVSLGYLIHKFWSNPPLLTYFLHASSLRADSIMSPVYVLS
jgi:hypothetical protein